MQICNKYCHHFTHQRKYLHLTVLTLAKEKTLTKNNINRKNINVQTYWEVNSSAENIWWWNDIIKHLKHQSSDWLKWWSCYKNIVNMFSYFFPFRTLLPLIEWCRNMGRIFVEVLLQSHVDVMLMWCVRRLLFPRYWLEIALLLQTLPRHRDRRSTHNIEPPAMARGKETCLLVKKISVRRGSILCYI